MIAKYELTDIRHPDFPRLHRIRALRDIPRHNVKAGDLGGWIEHGRNLSQIADAWVQDGARVHGDALVSGDALVYGNALVCNNAHVYGEARVYGDALVYGEARVYGDALVYGEAHVYGRARVYGSALVYGRAHVYGSALVYGKANVCGDAHVARPEHVLHSTGLPSGDSTLFRTTTGHMLRVGCWEGTTGKLRTVIAGNSWPEADTEAERDRRRPGLAALADLCDAQMTSWTWEDVTP